MAWNEPGGGNRGDKDPWGNRDNEGPPDLDEAFRKLQQNALALFPSTFLLIFRLAQCSGTVSILFTPF